MSRASGGSSGHLGSPGSREARAAFAWNWRAAGTLGERVKPPLGRQCLRRQADELPKLSDHVGLAGIAQRKRHLSPVNLAAATGIRQPRLESCQPAEELRRQADALPRRSRQVLPGDSCHVRQTLDGQLAPTAKHALGKPGYVQRTSRGRRCSKPREQGRREEYDSSRLRRLLRPVPRASRHHRFPRHPRAPQSGW